MIQTDLMRNAYARQSHVLHLLKVEVHISTADIFELCPNLSPLLQGSHQAAAGYDLEISNSRLKILGSETLSQTKGADPRGSCSMRHQGSILKLN